MGVEHDDDVTLCYYMWWDKMMIIHYYSCCLQKVIYLFAVFAGFTEMTWYAKCCISYKWPETCVVPTGFWNFKFVLAWKKKKIVQQMRFTDNLGCKLEHYPLVYVCWYSKIYAKFRLNLQPVYFFSARNTEIIDNTISFIW